LEHAKGELEKVTPTPAKINWKVSLYQLIVAYIVNFRDDSDHEEAMKAAQAGKMKEAIELIEISQKWIKPAADVFGLEYIAFVDLAWVQLSPFEKRSGPFCGVFVSKGDKPFMILSFKGTTNELEAGTDAFLVPTQQSNGILYNASVHMGMYQGLFRKFPEMTKSAFDIIWEDLEYVAANVLNGSAGNPIPLYVSGHSLGAGYAQLAYVELFRRLEAIEAPADAVAFNLKSLFAFAAPRVGTISGFANIVKEVFAGKEKPIFRYSNEHDVVPFIPGVITIKGLGGADVVASRWLHLDGGYILHRDHDDPYWTPDCTELPAGPIRADPDGHSAWEYHFPGEYYNSIKKILHHSFEAEFPPPPLQYPPPKSDSRNL